MKKLFTLFVAAMMACTASCADYQEGKHYTKVNDEVRAKNEVREYYSFYCPHCYNFEPFFADVKKLLPADVAFERNHVDFLRGASKDIQFMLSKALVTAQQLKVEEKLVAAIFKYIHVQRAGFSSEKDIRNIFVLNGVDGAKFDKVFKGFATNSKAKLMQKNQDYFANKRVLTGVPTVIVNGKYRIEFKELEKNNEKQDFANLVKYLQTLDK